MGWQQIAQGARAGVRLGEQARARGQGAELVEQRPLEYARVDDVEQGRVPCGQDQRLA